MEAILRRFKFAAGLTLVLPLLAACGGGSGDGGGGGGNSGSGWIPGNFLPSDTFINQCASPRSGTDPDGNPWPDVAGTVLDENNWLRSYSNETYLWYDEIVDRDPGSFINPLAYFDVLKTFESTDSGSDKDRFHSTVPTAAFTDQSQSGVAVGYGFQWIVINGQPPREVRVGYSDREGIWPQGVARGAEVLAVDGVDLVNDNTPAGVDALNAGLFLPSENESHEFELRYTDDTVETITLTAQRLTSEPVQSVKTVDAGGVQVGYLLFNDHIATAQQGLKAAVEELQGIDELVLDIRYNGGGFLAIASQLAYMIAGQQSQGQDFERSIFNDKHPDTDIFGRPNTPLRFIDTTLSDFGGPEDPEALPTLDLSRVFVLTGANTCSASESIINGLSGIDVEVIQIGTTSCGKPYGFFEAPNCGTSYFTIQFQGLNAKDFGGYGDGFSPQGLDIGTSLPGCAVADDWNNALGDVKEGRFAAALNYIETDGSCPEDVAAFGARAFGEPFSQPLASENVLAREGTINKPIWLRNRILTRP